MIRYSCTPRREVASSYFFNVLRRNKAFLCFSSVIIDGKRDVADPARKPNIVETNSRGRVAALRNVFDGFHIVQYRDPLSQFRSFICAVVEAGFWGFLSHPATELGTCATHPLYAIVPTPWRVPSLPWMASNRAQRWASDARYIAMVGAPERDTMEKVFRWHLFLWVLSNLAAVAYSDLALDMDKIHDDANYRASIVSSLAAIGLVVDFRDLKKFDRYYVFEFFDTETLCNQVSATIRNALAEGTLDQALRTVGGQSPVTPTATGVDILLSKMNDLLAAMAAMQTAVASVRRSGALSSENAVRYGSTRACELSANVVYPFAAPIVHAGQRVGLWN